MSNNDFSDLQKKAESGDAKAQDNLGVMYMNGQGVTKDYVEAVKWFRKSAEQGHTEAQCDLGLMYIKGWGVPKDEAKAAEWFRKSAEQGYAEAQCNLGFMYINGQGVTKDYVEAVKWSRKAAEQGYAQAQCNLGVLYDGGQGVTKDYVEAVKWFRKAAEQGNDHAQFNLGVSYMNGEGVPKDETKAAEWFHKSAEQGNAEAQQKLSLLLKNSYKKPITTQSTESVGSDFLHKNSYKKPNIIITSILCATWFGAGLVMFIKSISACLGLISNEFKTDGFIAACKATLVSIVWLFFSSMVLLMMGPICLIVSDLKKLPEYSVKVKKILITGFIIGIYVVLLVFIIVLFFGGIKDININEITQLIMLLLVESIITIIVSIWFCSGLGVAIIYLLAFPTIRDFYDELKDSSKRDPTLKEHKNKHGSDDTWLWFVGKLLINPIWTLAYTGVFSCIGKSIIVTLGGPISLFLNKDRSVSRGNETYYYYR